MRGEGERGVGKGEGGREKKGERETPPNLYFLVVLAASSMREGRESSEHRLSSPLAWKALPNKSRASRERRGKDGGRANSLLLLAEKNFNDDIFPNVLGRTWSWLQSSFN